MTNHLTDMLTYISRKMDEALGESATTGFASRTTEPSPGDIFDIHTDTNVVERYAYLSNDRIVPLYRMKNGEYVNYSGNPVEWVDVVTWDDIVDSMEYATYRDVYLEVISNKNSVGDTIDDAMKKVSDWAHENMDPRYHYIIRGFFDKLRSL